MTNNKTMAQLGFDKAKGQQEQYCKNELMLQKIESFRKKAFYQICKPVFVPQVVSAVLYFIPEEPPDNYTFIVNFFVVLRLT